MSAPRKTVALSKGNKDVAIIIELFEKKPSWHSLDRLPADTNIQELVEGKYVCGEPPMPIGPYNINQLLTLFRKWRTTKSGYAEIGRSVRGDALFTLLDDKVPKIQDLISTALEHPDFNWAMNLETKSMFSSFVKCLDLPSSIAVLTDVRKGLIDDVGRKSISRGKDLSKGRDAYFRKYK